MRRTAAWAAGWAVTAGLAPAGAPACPASPADLAAGIAVALDDGSVSRFRIDSALRIVEDVFFDESFSEGERFVYVGGILPVEWTPFDSAGLDPARGSRTDPGLPDDGLPTLLSGLRWSVKAMVETGEGARYAQTLTLAVGPEREERYGPCRYSVLPVVLSFEDRTGRWEDRLDFLPLLGIAVYRGAAPRPGEPPAHAPVAIVTPPPAAMPALD